MNSNKTYNLLVLLLLLVSATAFNLKQPVQNDKQNGAGHIVVKLNGKTLNPKTGISTNEKGILSVSLDTKQDTVSSVVFYLVRDTKPLVYKKFTQPAEYAAIDLATAMKNEYGVADGDRILLEVLGKKSYFVNIPVHK
ncbi:MAG: hypothetical protein LPJ89_02705 [Hymenobacteraceae bacterium]|nr:hypothetical protein [Hymenobacteraceae bacterium]MDX5396996.1 hypothetical protein [Hymenobacteraceae bacterium]MDX5442676.1 hypothetical protein [Hymenobacteraceae bacterium]MDX5513070.1 hypothetical protein [Hymenobacteraceae bacterium]